MPDKTNQLPLDKAIKIKCHYCEIADICKRRAHKEAYEKDGVATRCTLTPNRPGKSRKEKRKRKKK